MGDTGFMKVIIAGDRECNDYDALERAIMASGFKITEVISGGARGADKLGEMWAKAHKIPVKVFAANWDNIKAKGAKVKINSWGQKYNANAGFDRNEDMAEYAAKDSDGGGLIAMQLSGDTNGTQDMIKRAKKHGLQIYIQEKEAKDYEYDF